VAGQLKLPGDRLNYCGLVVVLGIVPNDAIRGSILSLTQRRIFETVDGTTRIYAMPFTTASTMVTLRLQLKTAPAHCLHPCTPLVAPLFSLSPLSPLSPDPVSALYPTVAVATFLSLRRGRCQVAVQRPS
jgi:hypothetical protein